MIFIIEIDKKSGIPIYLQVKKQIMNMIKRGELKVGQKVPTERELSETLLVSRNTISTAYNDLETEGVLRSIQGRGTFVAEEAGPWMEQNVKEKILKFIDIALEEAMETGMDSEEFLEIVNKRVKEKKEIMMKITAAYVECNIEQSRMFSKQLAKSTNMNVIPLTITDLKNMEHSTKEAIENSEIIISTFNHVNEVSELAAPFRKQVLGVAINADLSTIVKIARYPEETKFVFFCISEEFMFKIKNALESAGLGNINVTYSNTTNISEINKLINASEVIIVSPGRFKNISKENKDNKEIINFLYSLDEGSVKALKSKLIEINIKNRG